MALFCEGVPASLAFLAQLVERSSRKGKVTSSILVEGSKLDFRNLIKRGNLGEVAWPKNSNCI